MVLVLLVTSVYARNAMTSSGGLVIDTSLFVTLNNVLTLNNTNAYTPTADYHPATKKYVDDQIIGAGTGDVIGPAGANSNAIALFDGTTGKLLKDSGVYISDYFNKSQVNSTGLIGLICSNGQILEYSTGLNKWVCGTDSSGLSAIYSGNGLAYITGGDTVNVNQSAFDLLYYSSTNPAGYINLSQVPQSGINESFANLTYARIDGANQPFTGNISAPTISFNTSAAFVNTQIGMCYNGTDYIFGNYSGVTGCPS
jgi:hypothetical protein